jgi:hypothetical protein
MPPRAYKLKAVILIFANECSVHFPDTAEQDERRQFRAFLISKTRPPVKAYSVFLVNAS